ncbi:MAG TPA: hypothetical protein VH682_12635 [Gemmataceae bacterium]
MSYDPYSPQPDEPRPGEPYDNRFPASGSVESVKGRVQAPAIGLIVVGILNLLFGLYMVLNSVVTTVTPADKLKERQSQFFEILSPAMREKVEQMSADEMKTQALGFGWPLTLLVVLLSVLSIAGGVRMLSLKSYALGVCGAISAAIPCLSVTACCGLGEGIGIWALVVLLNPDVRSAFR